MPPGQALAPSRSDAVSALDEGVLDRVDDGGERASPPVTAARVPVPELVWLARGQHARCDLRAGRAGPVCGASINLGYKGVWSLSLGHSTR